jgi:hypothetical protein
MYQWGGAFFGVQGGLISGFPWDVCNLGLSGVVGPRAYPTYVDWGGFGWVSVSLTSLGVMVAANLNSPLRGLRGGCVKESAEQASDEATTRRMMGTAKLRIEMSADEHAELRRAVSESEFPNMALLVFQAIHAGLEGNQVVGVQKHTKTVTMHVSRELKQKIRTRARMYQVTQQALLRSLLFQYIRNSARLRRQGALQ